MSEDVHRFTVRLPEELDRELKELAEAEGRSLQSQVVHMLQDAVDLGITPVIPGTEDEENPAPPAEKSSDEEAESDEEPASPDDASDESES
jgi:hypothetical protein